MPYILSFLAMHLLVVSCLISVRAAASAVLVREFVLQPLRALLRLLPGFHHALDLHQILSFKDAKN